MKIYDVELIVYMSSCQLQTLPTLTHLTSTLVALIKTICLMPGRKWLGLGNRHTLRKQSTSAPCSELGQLEVTSQTRVFRIVKDDLKFGAVILLPKDGKKPTRRSHSWKVLKVVGVIVFGWNKIVNHTCILFVHLDKRWCGQSSRSHNFAVTPIIMVIVLV